MDAELSPAQIIGADPAVAPASFTRFVLPFEFRLAKHDMPKSGSSRFHVAGDGSWIAAAKIGATLPATSARIPARERRHYLTPDTAHALFDHAQWFVLDKNPTAQKFRSFSLSWDGATISCQLREPALVIFDFERHLPTQSSHASKALGLLILEVFYESETVALDAHLTLNELLRYWRCPYAKHEAKRKIIGDHLPSEARAGEGDPYTSQWLPLLDHALEWSGHDYQITPSLDGSVHADDRAYVWTCAVSQSVDVRPSAVHLQEAQAKQALPASFIAPWVRLLNIDGPGNSPATAFERRWALDRSYTRWGHYEALYGFTTHSGVMWTSSCSEPPTWQHFREIYFDHALLLLYLRARIFLFSEELSKLSLDASKFSLNKADHHDDLDGIRVRFRDVRWRFALFTNLYQFPLISKQQQALEMYELLRRELSVQELYDQLKTEVETMHDFMGAEKESRQADASERLNALAAVGLAASIALAMMGVGDPFLKALGFDEPDPFLTVFGCLFLMIAILGLFVVLATCVAPMLIGMMRPRDNNTSR